MRRTWNWAGFTLCFAAGVTMMWGHDQAAMQQTWLGPTPEIYATGSWNDSDASVPVSFADPAWGARSAPVTLVQFSDLTCGHCLELEETLAGLRKRFGPAQLRIVWKHLPHPANTEAESIHVAAEAVFRSAGPKAFWTFHEALVGPRRTAAQAAPVSSDAGSRAADSNDPLMRRLAELARAAGADPVQFQQHVAESATRDKVREDGRLARQLGVKGTPSCFVNGLSFTGVQPPDAFGAEIEQQLDASRALRVAGTPAERIYVTLTNANRPPRSVTRSGPATALLEP